MPQFNDLAKFSALPIVDLKAIDAPAAGIMMGISPTCGRNFRSSIDCKTHYENLANASNGIHQCPFGFSSIAVKTDSAHFALTGFIPAPRIGGEHEREMAKRFPDQKLAQTGVIAACGSLKSVENHLRNVELDTVNRHSMALHEIRKLNRTVKQTAERLCRQDSPSDPDSARTDLVRIWKTSDLMSQQFEVIEFLANERLATLPLNDNIGIYNLFDKCVRIYRQTHERRTITINAAENYTVQISACDKTVFMIPTVLIENALKYSVPDSDITIDLRSEGNICVVRVSNLTRLNPRLNDHIFDRGIRASGNDIEGSGNGLFVAQLVAKQHNATLTLQTVPNSDAVMKCIFTVRFRIFIQA